MHKKPGDFCVAVDPFSKHLLNMRLFNLLIFGTLICFSAVSAAGSSHELTEQMRKALEEAKRLNSEFNRANNDFARRVSNTMRLFEEKAYETKEDKEAKKAKAEPRKKS